MLNARTSNCGADYGARTHAIGINDNTKAAAETIAKGAKEAIALLESGDVSLATAILNNLASWGGQ